MKYGHRRRTHPATRHGPGGPKVLPGSTRHIPKILEPCRIIERSTRPTGASITHCCDQFLDRYDHCNQLGWPRNRLGRAAQKDGGPISDAYAVWPLLNVCHLCRKWQKHMSINGNYQKFALATIDSYLVKKHSIVC